jgi:hypothetical protein
MRKSRLAAGAALIAVLAAGNLIALAAPQPQARSVISYPSDGMTVSGAVEIRGIATHPNLNSYQLRYAAGPEPVADSRWVDFAVVQGTQVENDVLGVWDTAGLPSGQYTLALAVWGADDASSPYVFFVTRLTVDKSAPAETPTPEEPTPEQMATLEAGPTRTPATIEQPPTSTPAPTVNPLVEKPVDPASAPADEREPTSPIELGQLRGAFCSGGLIAVLLFVLWGLYLLSKGLYRWYLRGRVGPPFR